MFKLINFFDDLHFNQLRHAMQATDAKRFKVNTEITLFDEDIIRRLGQDGIEVKFTEIKPLNDRTLSYNGQRVLVYIRDVSNYRQKLNLPRFHISYCKKLEEMSNNGRWQRYVVANRDDGYFQVCINNGYHKSEILNVCQYCLETLRWSDFSRHSMNTSERQTIVRDFSISNFFVKYPKSLFSITPTHTSDTAPSNTYTHDWYTISETIKEERGYKCDALSCRTVLLGKDKRYLHVHHKNGMKNDNSKSNLIVLCIRCHAEEPYHSHMKSLPDYKEFLSKLGL